MPYLNPVRFRAILVLSAILFSAGGLSVLGTSTKVIAPAPAYSDVIVIHDSLPGPLPSGQVSGYNIIDLLGHFGLKGSLVSLEEYKPGDINHYRFAFVLAIDERVVTYPPSLLSDIRSTSVPVFWIEGHLGELLADPKFVDKLGFKLSHPGMVGNFDSVSYKGQSLPLPASEPVVLPVQILDNSKVQVIAPAVKKDGSSLPYIVRSGSFWYCADSPFSYSVEGDRYLVFCDVLHDFFKIPHQEERKALLRIEDVTIEEDPAVLRSLADYLYDRHVPFQISLVPIFKDPAEKEEVYLSDRPEFVRAIRYMVSKGGLVVMHGDTHQYHGKSGDDYEFWDEVSDKPIQGDSRALVEQKLEQGLEECFKNGIYPVTWETPHYMASTVDYQTFARYFNSSYDRVASVNRAESGHFMPYPTVDRFGRFIIPECLGFVPIDKPDPDLIVKNASNLQVVRDGVASFFFHPFLDRAYLEKALDGIEALGYRFVSIGDYDCRVQMGERLVQTFTETVQIPMHGQYLHRFFVHEDGRISGESYSEKPLDTVIKDPGLVPPDAMLVMEGVSEIRSTNEPPPPTAWDNFKDWLRKKLTPRTAGGTIIGQPQALVLWDDSASKLDWNNQQSYVSSLSAFGFQVSTLRWKEFTRSALYSETILVVPHEVALKLSSTQTGWISGFIRDGGRGILDGASPLSQELGVILEKRTLKVSDVQDLLYANQDFATNESVWNPPAEVVRFSVHNPVIVYAQDKVSELPMAVLARFGRGRFLYLAARLDATTQLGYTRFPYFVHYVTEGFNIRLPVQRAQLELYYDPGLSKRGGADIDRRAEMWRRMGVRAVYVGAYHFWPTWTYDYRHMIDVCHKNGILVYAWLELPHVSVKFWDDHPEWRAKTASGDDGLVGWRHNMDLDLPECRDAVFDFVENLLRSYPWDGVNIAELNYESDRGPENPKKYLPMGPSTRMAFKALAGFDPILLFKPGSAYDWKQNHAALKKFEEFRVQRVVAWHRAILERLTPLAQERDMEIIVTMLDSLHSRALTQETGVDSALIVGLMSKFPFTLQVEDPATFWAESPDRYGKFAKTYLGLVKDPNRLMFDINVVPSRDIDKSHSPTPTLAGIELAQTLLSASSASGRAAIYSEGTMPPEDLEMLSKVLAHNARVERQWNDWVTESDRSILLDTPGQWQNFRIDDRLWPGWGENEVLIPGGKHRISAGENKYRFLDTSVLDLHLLRCTANLDTLESTKRGIGFSYASRMRAVALFNRRPFEIEVDGQPLNEEPIHYSGHWSIRLPRGAHKVEVVADSAATVILERTSLYSSTLIVIFGTVASALMLLIYMAILVRRAVSRAVQGKAQ